MKIIKEYKIHDFYIACILLATKHPLLRIEKSNKKYVDFVFGSSKEKVEKTIENYWGRKLPVEARDLTEAISSLKTRIYSGV